MNSFQEIIFKFDYILFFILYFVFYIG